MTPEAADPGKIRRYDAHIYYDSESRDAAAELRRELEERFEVQLGGWHDEPVGPHPQSMYRIIFASEYFARVVPFLMLNRRGLTILVHPRTGNDRRDHTEHALWLGQKLDLNVSFFKRAGWRAELRAARRSG
jgi:DOPA 4,5-dioxygenase